MELWVKIALSIGHISWEDNLLGKLHPLHSETFTNEEEVEWDVGKPCIITLSTPWDILESSLLWFIWCQKCEQDLRERQVGTVAWRELHKFKRFIIKRKFLVEKFKLVRMQGSVFCKDVGSFQWQIVPNRFVIPNHLVDQRMGLLFHRNIQMFNNQVNSSNSNFHSHEEMDHRSPTLQNFQPYLKDQEYE